MFSETLSLPKFKPGNLVRIKESTHEDSIPSHRLGLVMETLTEEVDESRSYTAFYNVAFTGGKILKFHEMFLELVEE
tara:strand:- start:1882 stop:2112 length:231 start_codon:yes stop_codon:yes gene_type:complete